MLATYEKYLARIRTFAIKGGFEDLRVAREEFHRLCGTFEDGEPWYELRMSMFHDWYFLDRPGSNGLTPAEHFIAQFNNTLSPDERRQMELLTVTLRSVFEIAESRGDEILLDDLAGQGQWSVHFMVPAVGLQKRDIIDTRIVFLDGRATAGFGTVLHPHEAYEAIRSVVERARSEGMRPRELVDHLDKMRLKLDRYSSVRVQHVYKYPGDAIV